jgi:hypothetical protein
LLKDALERLEAEARATQDAVRDHLRRGVQVWYEQGESIGTADTPVDDVWLDRYHELKAFADEAEKTLIEFLRLRRPG